MNREAGLSSSNRQPSSTPWLSEAGTLKTSQMVKQGLGKENSTKLQEATGLSLCSDCLRIVASRGFKIPLESERLESRALEVCSENPGCRHGILGSWDHPRRDDQYPRG